MALKLFEFEEQFMIDTSLIKLNQFQKAESTYKIFILL